MSFLHLLLTPDQEHQKVFHKIHIIGFQRVKNLKNILEKYSSKSKVPQFRKMKGFLGHVKNRYVKFVSNTRQICTDRLESTTTQRTYFIRPPNLKCSSKSLVIYLHVKHAPNNIQEAHKISGQGSITIDVPRETFQKEKKLNKSHLTLIYAVIFSFFIMVFYYYRYYYSFTTIVSL